MELDDVYRHFSMYFRGIYYSTKLWMRKVIFSSFMRKKMVPLENISNGTLFIHLRKV